MLKDRMDYLNEMLATNNKQIAKYAGCSATNFSRIRSGTRSADEESTTVDKYVHGVCKVARYKDCEKRLCDFLKCNSEELPQRLKKWLFEENDADKPQIAVMDPAIFAKKMNMLMELAEISNSRLSRTLNIDASYISRIKRGERLPGFDSDTITEICDYIFRKLQEEDKLSALAEFMGTEDDELSGEGIRRWLYTRRLFTNESAVEMLINNINDMTEFHNNFFDGIDHSFAEEFINDERSMYKGNDGLRSVCLKFLGKAAAEEHKQLLLYSDQGMEWMTPDFLKKWSFLMRECINKGVRIKIIHNIDRAASEMFTAIISWMPLYISGMIEPYYCTKKKGERFSCTMFIDEGHSCIRSLCVKGLEDKSDYIYSEDQELCGAAQENFEHLLLHSRPLLKLSSKPYVLTGKFTAYVYKNTQICIGEGRVVVNKLTEPMTSFAFTHPLVCKAFGSFAEKLNQK